MLVAREKAIQKAVEDVQQDRAKLELEKAKFKKSTLALSDKEFLAHLNEVVGKRMPPDKRIFSGANSDHKAYTFGEFVKFAKSVDQDVEYPVQIPRPTSKLI